ncbi:FxLYD domain-containing protein [uncultured Paludibaculum sp.]|uniref:FxLYD domain-containing protein n=1 Tax=uncultured Paludibaculum sp. TaxID=1765020 RepID=UPI002AAA697E|nr:FxLYD domain-containing protein [uncultured Paludibaculum sp.]
MVTSTRNSQKLAFNSAPLVILAVVVLIAAVGFYALFLRAPSQSLQPTALTAEAKGYVRNLALSEVEMKASESYMKTTLVEIVGKITNNGPRTLGQVDINCVFYDPYGQLVLRERVAIVKVSGNGLKPGETRSFRLPFDSIPSSWNQALPQLVIARIEFAE